MIADNWDHLFVPNAASKWLASMTDDDGEIQCNETPINKAFHSRLKTLLFSKSYPDSSSSPYHPYPVSTQNTIHHSRLTVCLPDSLDLTRCLLILFWTSACE